MNVHLGLCICVHVCGWQAYVHMHELASSSVRTILCFKTGSVIFFSLEFTYLVRMADHRVPGVHLSLPHWTEITRVTTSGFYGETLYTLGPEPYPYLKKDPFKMIFPTTS